MAKFNAGTAVEAMEYDFTAYGGSKGIIPEPSNKQVSTFFDAVRSLAAELKVDPESGVDPEAMSDADAAEFMASMDDNVIEQYEDRIVKAIEDLCSGTPSADEVRRLPYRVNAAFSGWLAGELRPESQRPATKR